MAQLFAASKALPHQQGPAAQPQTSSGKVIPFPPKTKVDGKPEEIAVLSMLLF